MNIIEFFSKIIQILSNVLSINKNINDSKNKKVVFYIIILFVIVIVIAIILISIHLGKGNPSQPDDFNEEPSPAEDPIFSCEQYTNSDSSEDSLIHYRTNMTNISEPYKVTVHPYLNIVHLDNSTTQLIFLNNVFTQATYLSANGECDLTATIDIQEIRDQILDALNDNTIQIHADMILEISVSQNNEIHTKYMEYNNGQPIYCSDENYTDYSITTIDVMFFMQRKHIIIEEIIDLICNFSGKDG